MAPGPLFGKRGVSVSVLDTDPIWQSSPGLRPAWFGRILRNSHAYSSFCFSRTLRDRTR